MFTGFQNVSMNWQMPCFFIFQAFQQSCFGPKIALCETASYSEGPVQRKNWYQMNLAFRKTLSA